MALTGTQQCARITPRASPASEFTFNVLKSGKSGFVQIASIYNLPMTFYLPLPRQVQCLSASTYAPILQQTLPPLTHDP
jgi:hypothetical protein